MKEQQSQVPKRVAKQRSLLLQNPYITNENSAFTHIPSTDNFPYIDYSLFLQENLEPLSTHFSMIFQNHRSVRLNSFAEKFCCFRSILKIPTRLS